MACSRRANVSFVLPATRLSLRRADEDSSIAAQRFTKYENDYTDDTHPCNKKPLKNLCILLYHLIRLALPSFSHAGHLQKDLYLNWVLKIWLQAYIHSNS